MVEFLLDSIKIEIVTNKFVIDFTQKRMIFLVTKPLNPAVFGLRKVGGVI